MQDRFWRVACATPSIKVAEPDYNAKQITNIMRDYCTKGVRLLVFPELVLSGYTAGELFLQDVLVDSCANALRQIVEGTAALDMMAVIGMPLRHGDKLLNVAAVILRGRVLGFVPKTYIPNYAEFFEARYFASGPKTPEPVLGFGDNVQCGTNQIFCHRQMTEFKLGVEICEDMFAPISPSSYHALAGATVIANCSASSELVGKSLRRAELVQNQSSKQMTAYLYASAGEGESSTHVVYTGHRLIAENGTILQNQNGLFGATEGVSVADIDLQLLCSCRRQNNTFGASERSAVYRQVEFDLKPRPLELERHINQTPFIPETEAERNACFAEVLAIQTQSLATRLRLTGIKKIVLGLSGGLDSTLALCVAAAAFDMLGYNRHDILAVTMPCFGTTSRTYDNAKGLAQQLDTSLLEINIEKTVLAHFDDISHDPRDLSVTYENAQARERTQVLLDLANKHGGLVLGTGDLSEIALGWCTFGGDQLSMYNVNGGVPKTLVKAVVSNIATKSNAELKSILEDIVATPVSPELLPAFNSKPMQKTEEALGPYELHDFFLYYTIRYGMRPRRTLRLARQAFADKYDAMRILRCMRTFYERFFASQFKRSSMPDGPKIGLVALSPHTDFKMASDIRSKTWLSEIDELLAQADPRRIRK